MNYTIEYLTEINPQNNISIKKTQDRYVEEYTLAIKAFLHELCEKGNPPEGWCVENTNTSGYKVQLNNDNDEIETHTDYEVKFLKSIFIREKHNIITKGLNEFYSPCKVSRLALKDNIISFYVNPA